MIGALQITLTSMGIFPLLLSASPQSGGIVEEISKQLYLSDGKAIGGCDAILVSSPGIILSTLLTAPYPSMRNVNFVVRL